MQTVDLDEVTSRDIRLKVGITDSFFLLYFVYYKLDKDSGNVRQCLIQKSSSGDF